MPYGIVSLHEDVVEECLANGRRLKATYNKTIHATVVQWEKDEQGNWGREEFLHKAKFNPHNDIDDEGYITNAWFRMFWVQEIQEIDDDKWVLMKPQYFVIPDHIAYFQCYIDDEEINLLPSVDWVP